MTATWIDRAYYRHTELDRWSQW